MTTPEIRELLGERDVHDSLKTKLRLYKREVVDGSEEYDLFWMEIYDSISKCWIVKPFALYPIRNCECVKFSNSDKICREDYCFKVRPTDKDGYRSYEVRIICCDHTSFQLYSI